jgi:hypothetical protein
MNRSNGLSAMMLVACAAVILVLAGCKPERVTVFKPGVAYASAVGGADPTVSLSADRTSVATGDAVSLTSVIAVPSAETQAAKQVTWRYQIPSGFSLLEAIGPRPIGNQATVTWTNPDGSQGSATSNTVTVVVLGASLSLQPDANRYVSVHCGDIKPGEERAIILTLRYVEE